MRSIKYSLSVITVLASLAMSPLAFAESRDVVHNDYGTIVHTAKSGTCVRTKWMNSSDPCAPAVVEPPPAPAPHVQIQEEIKTVMSREERTIYFAFNAVALSPEMQQRLDTLATNLRADSRVRGARIVGYADRIGNKNYNEKLSKKRADNVRQYLVSKGMINTQIADTRWYGDQNPATSCDARLKRPQLIDCLQRDRRVEVEIDYATDVRASR